MGRSQALEIGGVAFEAKGAALEFLRSILYRYHLGERVNAEDGLFLAEALTRHPEYSAKAGAGIDFFEVRAADYGTRCFWIVRIDGTAEKFSFKACV